MKKYFIFLCTFVFVPFHKSPCRKDADTAYFLFLFHIFYTQNQMLFMSFHDCLNWKSLVYCTC